MTMIEQRFNACHATSDDIPWDPRDCVIAHYIERMWPWAHYVSVGRRTIQVYDYRCPHNPAGKVGACAECPGRCLRWATPLRVLQAIEEFDATGDAEFPAFTLREDEAREVPAAQDKVKKRQAMAAYRAEVASGERKPHKRTAKAKARSMSRRRRT